MIPNKLQRRTVVIGLDGATWDLIDPWMKGGLLPTFKKLVENGVRGHLKSTIPPHSAPAWTSAFTGVNPGKHNIFCFSKRAGYDLKLTLSSDRKAKPIWTILSEKGYRVVVINVPGTYPPEKVNGIMVSGMVGAPAVLPNYTYPKQLQDKLDKIGYVIDYVGTKIGDKERAMRRIYNMIEKRRLIMIELLKDLKWDLFTIVFTSLDRTQHALWHTINKDLSQSACIASKFQSLIQEVYAKLDSLLAEILDIVGNDTNVIVMSDHGFGPVLTTFHLNNWLRDNSYLVQKKTDTQRLYYNQLSINHIRKLVERFLAIFAPNARNKIMTHRKFEKMVSGGLLKNVDWSRTTAWALPEGFIAINLNGREPLGIIKGGEQYKKIRNELSEKLLKIKNPATGDKIVQEVYFSERLYSGKYKQEAPDILVQLKEGYVCDISLGKELFASSNTINGAHRLRGIFLASGPDIARGLKVDDIEIIDIVPTILHLMNLAISKEIEGRVMKEIFDKQGDPASRPTIKEPVNREKQRVRSKITEIKSKL